MALALLFSGQGAQKVGMGKSLYDQSPAARAVFDEADRVLGWSLTKLCFEGPDTELTQTKVCQPALFVHGMAVLAALKEAGKLPEVKYALGLSLGEITAYTAAGVFDFGTGLRVVAERGRLMQVAVKDGRSARIDLEVGICGEHGGDPNSIEFCHLIGNNYVSCSPFRVPVARLAAAQAAINHRGK